MTLNIKDKKTTWQMTKGTCIFFPSIFPLQFGPNQPGISNHTTATNYKGQHVFFLRQTAALAASWGSVTAPSTYTYKSLQVPVIDSGHSICIGQHTRRLKHTLLKILATCRADEPTDLRKTLKLSFQTPCTWCPHVLRRFFAIFSISIYDLYDPSNTSLLMLYIWSYVVIYFTALYNTTIAPFSPLITFIAPVIHPLKTTISPPQPFPGLPGWIQQADKTSLQERKGL